MESGGGLELWPPVLQSQELTYREALQAMAYMDGVEWSSWQTELDRRRSQERKLQAEIFEARARLKEILEEGAEATGQNGQQESWTSNIANWLCVGVDDVIGEEDEISDPEKPPHVLQSQKIARMIKKLQAIEDEKKEILRCKSERRQHWTTARTTIVDSLDITEGQHLTINMPSHSAPLLQSMMEVLTLLDDIGLETVIALGMLYTRLLQCFEDACVSLVWRSFPFAYWDPSGKKSEPPKVAASDYVLNWHLSPSGQEAKRIAAAGSAAFMDVDVLCTQAGSCKPGAILSEYALHLIQHAIVVITELLGMENELTHGLLAHIRRSVIHSAKGISRLERDSKPLPRRPELIAYFPIFVVGMRMLRHWYFMVKDAEFQVQAPDLVAFDGFDMSSQHIMQRKAIHKLGQLMKMRNGFALKALVEISLYNADWANRALSSTLLVTSLEVFPQYMGSVATLIAGKVCTGRESDKVKEALYDAIVDTLADDKVGKEPKKMLVNTILRNAELQGSQKNRNAHSLVLSLETAAEELKQRRQSKRAGVLEDGATKSTNGATKLRAPVTLRELREKYKDEEYQDEAA